MLHRLPSLRAMTTAKVLQPAVRATKVVDIAQVKPAALRRQKGALGAGSLSPFAYAETEFLKLRMEGRFFVDNSSAIETLRQWSNVQIMLRPPRFGKSLFLSMMEAYYAKHNSKNLHVFKGLDVEKMKVPGAGKYIVLRIDLSTDVSGDAAEIKRKLYNAVNDAIAVQVDRYKMPRSDKVGGPGVSIEPTDPFVSLRSFFRVAAQLRQPVMILVDEYDRFANKLLFENPKAYDVVVRGISGDSTSSFLRSFFETCKVGMGMLASGDIVDHLPFRMFVVGLSPLALADASGANIFTDLTHVENVTGMFGFRKVDIERAMEILVQHGSVERREVDELVQYMTYYYDGYRFDPAQTEPLYNPTACLYMFNKIWFMPGTVKTILENHNERDQLFNDKNVAVSPNVLDFLVKNENLPLIINDLRRGTVGIKAIKQTFSIVDLTTNSGQADDLLLSLMYYQGAVTYSSDKVLKSLTLPNAIVRINFAERVAELLEPFGKEFMETLDAEALKSIIQGLLQSYTAFNDTFNEETLKTLAAIPMLLYINSRTLRKRDVKGSVIGEKIFLPSTTRADLIVTAVDGRQAIIEFKHFMPHNMKLKLDDLLPYYEENPAQTKSTALRTEISDDDRQKADKWLSLHIHKWDIPHKVAAYNMFKKKTRKELMRYQMRFGSQTTPEDLLESARKQVRNYGKLLAEEQSQSVLLQLANRKRDAERKVHGGKKSKDSQKPLLFLVSSFWMHQLVVEQIDY
eukprot:Unigene6470_Nuclearia_a/m.19926 Unigene6470_Nuclearia_a/g.19926  ORF Unigene6470_Nuclearia_a/g.19926 Unigene6470_Nuclearia_a/m.19926 type:complete len:742 (-) Unigene6470_Nuclearia_a:54-2279(-)